jgi:DNA replication and repair protein RecF
MYLESLSIVNFKNYTQAELEFSPRINCLVGNNGVGKTNILDAIHYLALCKSFFNSIDSQNITHKQDFTVIQGQFQRDEKQENIYCGIQRNKRKLFKRNKKDYPKLSDHIGLIPLVMISPADSSLINDGGEERRKFINGVISQFDKLYLENIIQYNRVLTQRNRFLKTLNESKKPDLELIHVYNQKLISLGETIYLKRKNFVTELIPVFSRFYKYISEENEDTGIIYNSQMGEGSYTDLLEKNFHKDRVLQYTTVGIHRDDLDMQLSDYSIKKMGSQGQQKTFQVALKLAKFEFIRKISGITPILLLDDIFDKFDAQRVEQIIRLVSENNFGQIFITDTDEARIASILSRIDIENKVFHIAENQIISTK